MVVHARSDVVAVSIGPAFGGCGVTHSRPVEQGAPVKLWSLTCDAGCEDYLRSDPHWSSTLSEVPESHDESKAREDFDKRGARDKDQVLALALAKLAGVELPESLLRPITGNLPKAVALMECPNGHAGKPGAKFCADCGTAMQQPANAITAAPAICSQGHQNVPGSRFCATCGSAIVQDIPTAQEPAQEPADESSPVPGRPRRLRDERLDVLQQMARERGLSDEGNRAELISRIQADKAAA